MIHDKDCKKGLQPFADCTCAKAMNPEQNQETKGLSFYEETKIHVTRRRKLNH